MPATISEDILRNCLPLIRAAPAPLSILEIRLRLPKESRFPENLKSAVAAALRELPESEGVFAWPNFARQRDLFWNRSFGAAVREAIPPALDGAPLSISQLRAALQRIVPKAGESRLRAETGPQLRVLIANADVIVIGNRYCSPACLRKLAGTPAPALAHAVLEAVKQAESGAGNYVTLPELRKAPAFRQAIHDAVAKLARDGRIVLADFDTVPRPDQQADLFDIGGVWYIAVARKRNPEGAE